MVIFSFGKYLVVINISNIVNSVSSIELVKYTKDKLNSLKSNSDKFPGFVIDLVSFDIPFGEVVELAQENGFMTMTESKLEKIVEDNLDLVLSRRSQFLEERLNFLVRSSTDIIPELKSLYNEAKADFRSLKDEGRHKEAVSYLSNLTTMLNLIGRVQDVIREAEHSINVNVSTHGDLTLKVMHNLADEGAIGITDESTLLKQLGLDIKPASFVDRFRQIE